ncbi:MAG: urease accessory protein UreE [Alphaproteobacteria bacterium]|nr:urease accessory protein UreE [Alphaproteobacteria bacterium]
MHHATDVLAKGAWPESEAIATVTLAYHDRHRRRMSMATDDGGMFLLDLPHATVLGDGDGLKLTDGRYIRVCAASEAVVDIFCSSADVASKIAWHIGNRHTPMQVVADGVLRILDDHVLVDMVRGLGARVVSLRAAFAPESGAYAGRGGHGHGHSHGHRHDTESRHDH